MHFQIQTKKEGDMSYCLNMENKKIVSSDGPQCGLSHNENGVWEVVLSHWKQKNYHKTVQAPGVLNRDSGIVTIKSEGLYWIYAQVLMAPPSELHKF